MSTLGAGLVLLLASGAAPQGVRWERDFDSAQRKARRAERPIMIDFWATWCGWCRRLNETTYVDPEVVRLSEGFVAVKVNTEGTRREMEVTQRYSVTSLPTVAFLSPEGRLLLRVDGFQGPGVFPQSLRTASRVAERIVPLERALRRDGDDAEALTLLGQHLFEQDCPEESRALLQRATRRDEGLAVEQRKRTRMFLGLIQKDERRYAQAAAALEEGLSLRPAHEYDAKLLLMLGLTYADWQKPAEARGALERVVKQYPRTPMAQKAREALVSLGF